MKDQTQDAEAIADEICLQIEVERFLSDAGAKLIKKLIVDKFLSFSKPRMTVENVMEWLGKYTVLVHKTGEEEHIYSVCGIVDTKKLDAILTAFEKKETGE